MTSSARFDPPDRFRLMLFLALLLHLLAISGWLPGTPWRTSLLKPPQRERELEVTWAHHPNGEEPILSEFQAPTAQSGQPRITPDHTADGRSKNAANAPVSPALPRPRFATAAKATQQAEYLIQFKEKIEATGLAHYPNHLIGNGFYQVTAEVLLNPSGHILNIQILKKSGLAALDEITVELIRNAAPFPPVPEILLSTHRTLKLVRTLEFGHRRG